MPRIFVPLIQPLSAEFDASAVIQIQPTDVSVWLKMFTNPLLALDCETFGTLDPKAGKKSGLHPRRVKIRTLQFSDGHQTWVVDLGPKGSNNGPEWKPFIKAFREAAKTIAFVGHNMYFDAFRCFGVLNVELCKPICTMLGLQVFYGDYGADPEADRSSYQSVLPGGYSLKNAARIYLQTELDKAEQNSSWGSSELTDDQLAYAAKDAWVTFHLYKSLVRQYHADSILKSPGGFDRWRLENRFLVAAVQFQSNGYPFDADIWERDFKIVKKEYDRLQDEWESFGTGCLYSEGAKLLKFIGKKYGICLQTLDKKSGDHGYAELEARSVLYGVKALMNSYLSFGYAGAYPRLRAILLSDRQKLQAEWESHGLPSDLSLKGTYAKLINKTPDSVSTFAHVVQNDLLKAQAENNKEQITRLKKQYKELTGKSVPSNVITSVSQLNTQYPAIAALRKKILKFDSDFEKVELYESQESDRIHTAYSTLTGFGRCSSNSGFKGARDILGIHAVPNRVNPHIKHLGLPAPRSFIRVKKGKHFVKLDFTAAHFRVAVQIAMDKIAIAMLSDPSIDGHSPVAYAVYCDVFSHEYTFDEFLAILKDKTHPENSNAQLCRDTAKNTLYAVINVAGALRIQAQILANTSQHVPLNIVELAREKINARYPELTRDRRRILKEANSNNFIFKLPATALHAEAIDYCNFLQMPDGCFKICMSEFDKFAKEPETHPRKAHHSMLAATWSNAEAHALKGMIYELDQQRRTDSKMSSLQICGPVHDEADFTMDEEQAEYCCEQIAIVTHKHLERFMKDVTTGVTIPTPYMAWND